MKIGGHGLGKQQCGIWMDMDAQVAPSTRPHVPGGSRQRPEEEAEGAIDDEDPNIANDFDDM
jgi:hypothetical protein